MKSSVALIRCDSYDYPQVKKAVARGMELLGGAARFVRAGEKIVLKVNLLAADTPDRAVTTHPSVFRAVAECLIPLGVKLLYGDSPSFGTPYATAKKGGLTDVAEELQIELADFKEGKDVYFEGGLQNKKFFIANGILEADGVISLPKLKTHGLERYTGCIKNQFGCIVGMRKGEFHVKLHDAHDFGKMLVDLNNFVRPRLYVMDGIVAMEGNGPRGGNPKSMNVLLFSTDPVALDATACRLINLDPLIVPTTRYGKEAGSGTYIEDEIELVGDDFASFRVPDFDVERSPIRGVRKSSLLSFINNRIVPKPYIIRLKCTKCGTCVNNCPVEDKAVNWLHGDKTQPPAYDYDKCIRCYCCQELCPESAIELRDPLLRKVLKII